MPIRIYVSTFTLNVNVLNSPTKRHRPAGWIQNNGYKNKIHTYAIYKRPTSDLETHTDWK